MPFTMLTRVDERPIPKASGEIRAFVTAHNERHRLMGFLDHHRSLGVGRFFFADNKSDDGTLEMLLRQPDCHVFAAAGNHFAENVTPPHWLNAMLNTFGDGHWCLTLDCDELFVFPHYETLRIGTLVHHLDAGEHTAIAAAMIDMYPPGPLNESEYRAGMHFLDACPMFDPAPGWSVPTEKCPGFLMFGGVRERVFWRGRNIGETPPCISKVPLVRWQRGMAYVSAAHVHSGAVAAPLQAAILHFKFLDRFAAANATSLSSNAGIAEKGLSERQLYAARLAAEPKLALATRQSKTFRDSRQLVDCGWMTTTRAWEKIAANASRLKGRKTTHRRKRA